MNDTRLTLQEVRGSLNDLTEKLSGKEGAVWHAALNRFLRKENPWPSAVITPTEPADFPIWKTIKLGTGLKTADDFRKALQAAGCRLNDWANGILGKPAFKAADEETEVDLAVRSVGELGLVKGATLPQICERAKELGLDLCPAEVGPQLRLQYLDQPVNEWLVIAMEPITDSGGDPEVFNVIRDNNERGLGADCGDPGRPWGSDDRFVFVRRKSA